MSALDGSIVHHRAAGDLPRHPPRSARAGQHQLPAVDDHGLPAGPGGAGGHRSAGSATCSAGCRIYNVGFVVFTRRSIAAVLRSVPRRARRAVADRLAGAAGDRRLDADGQLGGDPDRRLSGRPARPRARHQPGRGARRPVHRPGRGRPARGAGLAGGVLGQRAGRRLRHDVGLPQAARHRRRGAPAGSTGGATSPSPSASARCWSRSPTASSRTGATPWAGPTRWCIGLLVGRGRPAGGVRRRSRSRIAEPMFQLEPVPRSAPSPPGTSPASRPRSPAAVCSSC